MATTTDAHPGLFLLLLGGVFIVLAGGVFVAGGDAQDEARRSRDWPTVKGEVTTFEYESVLRSLDEIESTPGPRNAVELSERVLNWEYAYVVDGTPYTSRRDDWGDEDRRSLYGLGSEVTVYYDPSDPSNAVLDPGSEPMSRGVAWIPLLMGAYLVYGGWEKRRRALTRRGAAD